jgi:transposase
VVATAHKIARTVYAMLKHHVAYEELGATAYNTQQRERNLAFLRKKAAKLGAVLVFPEPAQTVAPAPSG